MIRPDANRNDSELWLLDINRGQQRRLATANVTSFAWMRDSRRIVYRKAGGGLFSRRTDFSDAETEVARAETLGGAGSIEIDDVSLDGKTLVLTESLLHLLVPSCGLCPA